MMNKNTSALASSLVVATTSAIVVTYLVSGGWPGLHIALLLAIFVGLWIGFFVMGVWIMFYRADELDRKLPISGAERRRRNRQFYEWLRSQGRR